MMLHVVDDLKSSQFLDDVQLFVRAAVCLPMPSIIGAAPEVAAAARMQIEALNRASEKLEASFHHVHGLVQSIVSGPGTLSCEQAIEDMELLASVDTMVFGQAGIIRYQLRHQIEYDPNLGEFREPLVDAYRRAISVLESVHGSFLLLMSHTRQFMPPPRVMEAEFNPTRSELDALASASIDMLESVKAGEPIEFV